MFSSIFIARPKMSMVISLVLTIMGIIGFSVLPVEQFRSFFGCDNARGRTGWFWFKFLGFYGTGSQQYCQQDEPDGLMQISVHLSLLPHGSVFCFSLVQQKRIDFCETGAFHKP